MDSTTALLLLVFVFAGVSLWRDVAQSKERKDLLDRLMAKDLPEYRHGTGGDLKPTNSLKEKVKNNNARM